MTESAVSKTIRELADQIEQVKRCVMKSRQHQVVDQLLNKAIAHGAFSGTEFLTMHAIMDSYHGRQSKYSNSDDDKAWYRVDECRAWLRAQHSDLGDDKEPWGFTIIASALRDEANKMADAPQADGQTSTDDGDLALHTADEWRVEILAGQVDALLSLDGAGGCIGMSEGTIYRMLKAGLPCSPPMADGQRKHRRVWKSDLLAWHCGTHPSMETTKK